MFDRWKAFNRFYIPFIIAVGSAQVAAYYYIPKLIWPDLFK